MPVRRTEPRHRDFFADLPEAEPSATNGFAGGALNRLNGGRGANVIADAIAHPGVGFYLFHGEKAVLKRTGKKLDPLFSSAEAMARGASPADTVLLGRHRRGPRLAAVITEFAEEAELVSVDLRTLALNEGVPVAELGVLAHGRSLTAWNAKHTFCVRCGNGMQIAEAGYRRDCLNCGAQEFPRTDPVVIMLVVDGDRCLLGRQPRFKPGSYSCLAGFLEPGETIEAAVRREVLEEAGVKVGRVRYYSSQPWPFPSTLMIGCLAEAKSKRIRIDREELEDCRWFSREEVLQMFAGNHRKGLTAPAPLAIANRLVRFWAEG